MRAVTNGMNGTKARGPVSAVLFLAGALALSGCSGFLVPAGEGEPEPADSRRAAVDTGPLEPSAAAVPPGPRPTPPATPPATPPPGSPPPADVPAQGAPAPSAATAGCPSSGAVVDMGPVRAVMFARAVVLTLTNCGTQPYRVDGYPSVQALGEEGERIPVKVNPGGSVFGADQGVKRVVLKPGGTVKSILAWVSTKEGGDLIEGDALEIAPATDTGVRVFPLEGHDLRLMDELNMTAWRTELPE